MGVLWHIMIDEDSFNIHELEQISEVFAEIAERISYTYDLTDDETTSLYYAISELEMEYGDNPVITVYDLAGRIWPAPEGK